MDVLVLCAKTALACLLIVAGSAKLSDPASFASTVRLFIPLRVAWPLLTAMVLTVLKVGRPETRMWKSWTRAFTLQQSAKADGCPWKCV